MQLVLLISAEFFLLLRRPPTFHIRRGHAPWLGRRPGLLHCGLRADSVGGSVLVPWLLVLLPTGPYCRLDEPTAAEPCLSSDVPAAVENDEEMRSTMRIYCICVERGRRVYWSIIKLTWLRLLSGQLTDYRQSGRITSISLTTVPLSSCLQHVIVVSVDACVS